MKQWIVIAAAALAAPAAFAAKSCDELKTEIAQKIESKGVKSYTLEAVETDKVGEQKVVGSCEGGKKKLVYAKK
jgi:hypothetical protein